MNVTELRELIDSSPAVNFRNGVPTGWVRLPNQDVVRIMAHLPRTACQVAIVRQGVLYVVRCSEYANGMVREPIKLLKGKTITAHIKQANIILF
jgi:hypothetical protein